MREATEKQTVWARLGVKPVINGRGIYTSLGGSRLSPSICAAMLEINEYYVSMGDLLESSGRVIARHIGTETARVIPGCSAAIMLMVASVLTGDDVHKTEVLPSTDGLRDEIVLQRNHQYRYERQITMTGAKIVRAGDEHGTTPEQVRDAITPRTAALFLPAHLDDLHNTVPLPTFSAIAREHGLPTLVDAAHMCWPLENLTRYSREGADLVCFSAKYFGGPNAAGFIAGKRALITAVTYNDFIQFETSKYNTYGRPLKMDRHTIAATVLALEEWLTMDHEERWATYHRMVKNMHRQLEGISGITLEQLYYTMEEQLIPSPVNSLVVYFAADAKVDAKTAAAALAAANPSILVNVEPDNKLIICVDVAEEGEETIIAESLRAVLCA